MTPTLGSDHLSDYHFEPIVKLRRFAIRIALICFVLIEDPLVAEIA